MNAPLCWDERIEQAFKRGYFEEDDRKASDDWESCSLGEALSAVDVDPTDVDLRTVEFDQLGREFTRFVDAGTTDYNDHGEPDDGDYPVHRDPFILAAQRVHEQIKAAVARVHGVVL